MAKYDPEQIGFIDETSKDKWTVYWRYGQSSKGHCANSNLVFVHGCQTTIKALLTLDGIIFATVVEGSMTQTAFLDWLENNMVCALVIFFPIHNRDLYLPKYKAYPAPSLCVIMMDNAKIHHGAEILEIFDGFGKLDCFFF